MTFACGDVIHVYTRTDADLVFRYAAVLDHFYVRGFFESGRNLGTLAVYVYRVKDGNPEGDKIRVDLEFCRPEDWVS